MQTSTPAITTATDYLTNLSAGLRYVGRNRKALIAAGIMGDHAAHEIVNLYLTIGAGDYRKSQIERFNTLVEEYQNATVR